MAAACGMDKYKASTSRETSVMELWSGRSRFSMVSTTCCELVTSDLTLSRWGESTLQRNPEILSVGPEEQETIGRTLCGVLCTFLRKYISWVLVPAG